VASTASHTLLKPRNERDDKHHILRPDMGATGTAMLKGIGATVMTISDAEKAKPTTIQEKESSAAR
jgi:hypothetical protein